MSITELDEQCIRGQRGVLCGACKPGLSHILGLSHECRKCSNKKLYLYIIPSRLISCLFILFTLTVLNVTVTEGTINGLNFIVPFYIHVEIISSTPIMYRIDSVGYFGSLLPGLTYL